MGKVLFTLLITGPFSKGLVFGISNIQITEAVISTGNKTEGKIKLIHDTRQTRP